MELQHAELAGKLLANKREAIRLRTAMMQVEAVVKMLQPDFNVQEQPMVNARDAVQERRGRAAAGWQSYDGAGDYRTP